MGALVGTGFQPAGVWIAPTDGELDGSKKAEVLGITLLCLGGALQSLGFASMNNLRFAVAYFSTAEFLPKATALVVLGGALGALIGPFLTTYTRVAIPNQTYVGNFLQAAVLWLLFSILTVF